MIIPRTSIISRTLRAGRLHHTTSCSSKNVVNIVEVGPRDGLQNEKGVIPVDVKVELINRLGSAGTRYIESGSFVSPKWVPQMAGTAEVISQMERLPDNHYAVLVPNQKGLDNLFTLLDSYTPSSSQPNPPVNEIAIFTAASDAFSRANTNISIADSLTRFVPVVRAALERNLRVRGYISTVISCPFSGQVDYKQVRDIAKELMDMGCYEVSLGDTVGTGTPASVAEMVEEVKKSVPVENLAGHFHDTFGTGVVNVLTALQHGIRTVDSSVGGLGGCPYSPGATGNVATEDVLYALQGSEYDVSYIDLEKIVDIGWWISEKLARENTSRAGRAVKARRLREAKQAEKAKL
ncbi:hypothetical protein SERLA73DRAFT_191502 [Serpula lacrymans var. lacrymans S7.3]|uniref:hydroxymethylglutaryl-CoA lyase n=2 Tax=Serpula lacrymans var. lacrymans TaxID=341189 RepID=F8QHQ4_SERL3|nr:uncharacterized protein SERLADRAFT_463919 [Serpula lacrymans var. lacrymans S7.9]EGN92166.1 hypothetical protein SERLA73DRAFT_191502 [Serpula lacrymans var. lacrymans S7.3]EGO26652.1 hypothetical protein SERLADRAFT_463919 [Serpula lacrymans var. lacrymans S7.9]